MIRGLLRRKASASPKYRASSAKLSRWRKKCFSGVQAVLNGFEPLVHEQLADL
jgi:hypothetical protein